MRAGRRELVGVRANVTLSMCGHGVSLSAPKGVSAPQGVNAPPGV